MAKNTNNTLSVAAATYAFRYGSQTISSQAVKWDRLDEKDNTNKRGKK